MSRGAAFGVLTMFASTAYGAAFAFEGDAFPEDVGWVRGGTFDADRFLQDGWFIQQVDLGVWEPPPGGEQDSYTHSLGQFIGAAALSVEWRVATDAPRTEINGVGGGAFVLTGGPVMYHFTMAEDQIRLVRGVPFENIWVDIEPGIPHTYRLEVFGADEFRWYIDDDLILSDVPEGCLLVSDASVNFRAKYYLSPSRTSWDYIRIGTIPEPAAGTLLLVGSALALRRRQRAYS